MKRAYEYSPNKLIAWDKKQILNTNKTDRKL
jgi:hypothetical protein